MEVRQPSARSVEVTDGKVLPAEGLPADGTVVREWGDFIPARDIRVHCRDVPQVVRSDRSMSQFTRRCDTAVAFDHPYARFTIAQLEQIADQDAEAAYLLAYRLLMTPAQYEDPTATLETGLSYALKALLQTGEKQAFDLLIDGRHFGDWTVWATIDGTPTPEQVQEKAEEYVWYKAGRNLGFIAVDDFHWQELAGVMQRFAKYFSMADLNRQAREISDSISTSLSGLAEDVR